MMDCVLGIDLGTSYFKLALFDVDGRIRGSARISVPKRVEGNRCELDADVFWQVLRTAVAQVCAEADITARQIVALSYASQANSFLLLDADNAPLTPLVLWPDLRASNESHSFMALWNRPDFLEVTGLGLCSPEFMAAKICWFQQHAPETWARTRRIMTISDYLVYGATGEFRGDESTASLLGLWDVRAHAWWEAACDALEIPASYLAAPRPTGDTLGHRVAGRCRPPGAAATHSSGRRRARPLHGGHRRRAWKHLARSRLHRHGPRALTNCTQWHPRPGCCAGPARHRGSYYQMAFSDNGAAVLEWYQRVHASEYTVQELLDQAASVSADADGLVARPSADRYPGLEGFLHASPRHRHGHYIRALLASSAAELAQLAETLFGETAPACIAATGGGARSDLWMQIKADAVGAEFVVTACPEPACLGAALIAAVAAKWFDDVEAASAAWIVERRRFVPRIHFGGVSKHRPIVRTGSNHRAPVVAHES